MQISVFHAVFQKRLLHKSNLFFAYLYKKIYFCNMTIRLKKIRNYYKTIACSIAILILSILPGKTLPKFPEIQNIDKVEHFAAYFLLTICLLIESKQFRTLKQGVLLLLYPITYGVLMELLQFFTYDRTPSLLDIVANSLGAIVALLIFQLIRKRHG